MKRNNSILIIIVFMLAALVACQVEEQPNIQEQLEVKTEIKLVEAVPGDSVNTAGMTLLREFSNDLDLDGTEEKIELYTAAGRNEKGEMIWDDGQNWVLAVRDGELAYPLLSQFVQLGVVHFAVSNNGERQIPNITVMVPTGASFIIKGYTFDKDKAGFQEQLLYKSEDDNWIYSSIPNY